MKEARLSDQILTAHRVLREHRMLSGCTSYVQRRIGCGYNRASLLVSFLEDSKVISFPDQTGYRRWLMEEQPAAARLQEMI